ncbi:MAG: M1 family metallopeptidase [Flavobacteriales bacterium]
MTFWVFDKSDQKRIMQIDLKKPMNLDKVLFKGEVLSYTREGNVYFINFEEVIFEKKEQKITLFYSGYPKIAKNPPWDGGWIFKTDQKGRPWMSVSCQGLGASVWYPNKDYLGDEPDEGVLLTIETTDDLVAVGNGRLEKKEKNRYTWRVTQPISNYNIVPYIGSYVNFKDEYTGERGLLDLDYWVLDYNVEKAKKQFQQVKPMMKIFENWFGPYPFYEDSYKLVEAPHLGMEHQSNIAYGNRYKNGYLGDDVSGSGWGVKWDFIIIHETGHEWFGNNVTNKDIADMWIHESFTSYSETLYVESLYGKQAGNDYVVGTRKNIMNDIPIIGIYHVNQEGSGDMYYKGANVIHTLRQLLDDDQLFKKILRGINKEFYHQTITTQQIESYISRVTGKDLTSFFDQYLRTNQIPILEYFIEDCILTYRWKNVIKGFNMPVKLKESEKWIFPTAKWKKERIDKGISKRFDVDRNFYIKLEEKVD